MAAKGTLQIDVLGTSFTIQAEESSTYLESLYEYYKKNLKEIELSSRLHDPLRISILAGMMLCDEVFKNAQKNEPPVVKKNNNPPSPLELVEAEKITLKLIDSIDSVL